MKTPSSEVEKTPEDEFYEMLEERESLKVYTFDEEAESKREWGEEDFKQVARSLRKDLVLIPINLIIAILKI